MNQLLTEHVQHILDTATGEDVEVIVQIEADRGDIANRLARTAGQAIRRRRLILTPRDLLPQSYGKRAVKAREAEGMKETAGTRARFDQAREATFALKRIQKSGWHSTDALIKNPMVQGALVRMLAPTRRSSLPKGEGPNRFWTSRAMPLHMKKEELNRFPRKVEGIKAIHLNRHLSVPSMMETRRHRVEEEEVLHSTWGLERCNALAAWGLFGSRGRGVTIGLLDTGMDAEHPDLKGKIAHWAEFNAKW